MTTSHQIAEEMATKACAAVINQFFIDSLTPDRDYTQEAEIYDHIPLVQFIELAMAVNTWNKAPAGTTEENAQRVGLIIDALEALKATEKAQWL